MQGAYDEKADLWSIGVCTYMLLARGSKPFEGKTAKEMVANVLGAKYTFDEEIWNSVSDSAKTFIEDLLVVDAKLRPSASEAWKHPWIDKESSQHGTTINEEDDIDFVDEAFTDRVRECIIRYADTGPFRKLALNVIAKRSAPKDIFKLRKVFYAFDTLNTGTITLEEFREALSQSKYSEADLQKIFVSLDLNRTNVINYTEFLAGCLEVQGELEEYRLAEAFDLMDSDDSGFISRENLRQILGIHSDENYIDQLIAEADFDKNGKISYNEFLQVFSRENRKRMSSILIDLPADAANKSREIISNNSADAENDFEDMGIVL
jgi:calcium-dependent protein kinase